MHLKLIIILIAVQSLIAQKHACVAPNGQEGECVSLLKCPAVNKLLANPPKVSESYLRRFICKIPNFGRENGTTVCCGDGPSNVFYPAENLEKLNRVSDKRYCGLQHTDDRSFRNVSIAIDEFPWAVVLLTGRTSNVDSGIRCSGTLISERYVLTAAECVHRYFRAAPNAVVRLGEFQLETKTDCVVSSRFTGEECSSYEDYGIEESILHPFYDFWSSTNNIALLRLDKDVTYTDYIRPICLPLPGTPLADQNSILYSTGLGDLSGKLVKKKIMNKLAPQDICYQTIIAHATGRVGGEVEDLTTTFFCTDYLKNNTDQACADDIGGPTMHSHKHQWYVEGIIAIPFCRRNRPMIHVNVSNYLGWIQENIIL